MHNLLMSKLNQYLIANGTVQGKAQLVLKLGKSQAQIERYIRGDSKMKPEIARKFALAVGCTDAQALQIASACAVKRSA